MGSDRIAQAGLELVGSRHHSALVWAAGLQAVVTVSLVLEQTLAYSASPLPWLLLIRETHWGSAFFQCERHTPLPSLGLQQGLIGVQTLVCLRLDFSGDLGRCGQRGVSAYWF